MNNISWFIYVTQITDNFQDFLRIVSVLALTGVGVTGVPALIGKFDDCMGDGTFYRLWLPVAKKISICALAALAFSALLPSRQTMILIAASELGDRMLKSEDVKGIANPGLDLVRKWIKQQSDKIKDKDNS